MNFTILENGIRIFTHHDSNAESAALGVYINVGSGHETLFQNGLAHMLEHALLKGRTNSHLGRSRKQTLELNACFHAYTTRQETAFLAQISSIHLPQALKALLGMITTSSISLQKIDEVRREIDIEICEKTKSPSDIAFDAFLQTCFQDHSIGRPVLGTSQTISNFNLIDLKNFKRKHYLAPQLLVCGVGNVNHDLITKISEIKLQTISKELTSPIEPIFWTGGRREVFFPVKQSFLYIGFGMPWKNNDSMYSLTLLAYLLNDSLATLSDQNHYNNEEESRFIFSRAQFYRNIGVLGIFTKIDICSVNRIIKALGLTLKDMSRFVSKKNLEESKNRLIKDLFPITASVTDRLHLFSESILKSNKFSSKKRIVENIQRISEKRTCQLMEELLSTTNPAVTILSEHSTLMQQEQLIKNLTISCGN